MLTQIQIDAQIQRIVDIMKKNKKEELPPYHDLYQHSVEMKQAIEIHAVVGKKPDKLVAERAPNQNDDEFRYVMANYQQTTLPVFLDTVHTMQRAFSETNWAVDYNGEDDNSEIKLYLEQGMKDTSIAMGYYDYMFNVAGSAKLIDAQGVLTYKPESIPVVEQNGEFFIDPAVQFNIIPQYYPSEAVVAYELGKWYVLLTDEKSWVEWGNTTIQEGLVFEVYDDTNIYKVIQVGKKVDWKFETVLYFQHNCGYCPIDRLKGIPVPYGKEILYQSPFLYAVPSLNDVVLDSIMLRSIKAASVYPRLVMQGNICDNTKEVNGEIQNCNGNGYFEDFTTHKRIECTVCKGTGAKGRMSPHGVLLLRPETMLKDGELKGSQPAMYFVEPSVEIPKYLSDQIDKNTIKARNILHLRTSDSTVKGSEDLTATGQVLDEKALISVVKTFRDQMAASIEFGVKTIGIMRDGAGFESPVFTWTNSFDFLTEFEYMQKISEAIKNGMPSFVVYAEVYKYITTVFYDDSTRAKSFDLLVNTDRLLVLPYDQINLELAKGIIAPWQVVLHDSGISIIKSLTSKTPGFLEQDVKDQQDQLIAEAKRLSDEAKSVMPTEAGNVIDAVLRRTEAA